MASNPTDPQPEDWELVEASIVTHYVQVHFQAGACGAVVPRERLTFYPLEVTCPECQPYVERIWGWSNAKPRG